MSKESLLRALQEMKKIFQSDQDSVNAIEFLKSKVEHFSFPKIEINNQSFPLPKNVDQNSRTFFLFCDGACRGNPGPGAWAAMGQNSKGELLFEISGINGSTTNNKMELTAAIKGMEELLTIAPSFERIYIYSDSKYLIDGIEKWVPDWKKRGWKKADKKTPENIELWQRLDLLKSEIVNLTFSWVQGHSGHPQNENCDRLANKALDEHGY